MADYKVTDTELTSIANAIRAKTGGSAQIEFPAEFVSEIGRISGGGATNILSGTDAPTASVGSDGDLYLQYGGEAETQSLSGFSIKKESSMSVSVSESEVEFVYGSGGSIGAQAYKQVDLTDINTITVTMASGSHSYNNYQTERFAPMLFIENNVNPASNFVADNATVTRYIRIGEDNKTVTKTINVSQFTGNYWIVFSSIGCDSTVTDLTFGGDYIFNAYCKVNGVWQDLIGTDIDDVNTGE